ncbi:Holliday junction resolvase RuvX [Rubrobacter marinus]|uniref:Holliday junction resolvase RuvX n=1 Tax=Rubrobacter marinus TaxID=2653852 RepID=A0A6G8Q2T6_9ACTN|nr:Holliday junction resolvase RuvX [Rubrobacter marinus]
MAPARSIGRVAALDIGEAYTGVAISDTGATLACPSKPCRRRSWTATSGAVRGRGRRRGRARRPKTLGGEIGFQARRVLERAKGLEASFPGCASSSGTSASPRAWPGLRSGRGKGGRRRGGKERVDHLAAAAMLQEYLDRRGDVAASR